MKIQLSFQYEVVSLSEVASEKKVDSKAGEKTTNIGAQKESKQIQKPRTITLQFKAGPLGMRLATFAGGKGCGVSLVAPNSQAANLGVKKGFKIVEIAGEACRDAEHGLELLKSKPRPVSVVFSASKINQMNPKPPASPKPPGPPNPKSPERKADASHTRDPPKESKETVSKKVIIMRKIRETVCMLVYV